MFDDLYNSINETNDKSVIVQADIITISGKQLLSKDGGIPFIACSETDPMTALLKLLGTELGISYCQIMNIKQEKSTQDNLIGFSVVISSESLILSDKYFFSEIR